MTPNALRLLDHLGALSIIKENRWGETINAMEVFNIYTGKIAESSFAGPDGLGIGNPPYKVFSSMLALLGAESLIRYTGTPYHAW